MENADPGAWRQLYEQACSHVQCRPNSQVRHLLDTLVHTRDQQNHQKGASTSTESDLSDRVALDLSSNIIGSKGLAVLLRLVSAAKGLHVVHLNLCGNFLTNDDVVSLCAHLEAASPPTLQTLDVSDNAISQPAGKRLYQCAQRLPTLLRLCMGNTLINIGLQRRIEAILSKRRAALASTTNYPSSTLDGQVQVTDAHVDHEAYRPPATSDGCGIALVAPPPQSFPWLHHLYSHLRTACMDEPSSIHLTTVLHQPIALLMLSSRHCEDVVGDVRLTRSATPLLRTMDGALVAATAVVDEADTPVGTIGHALLHRRRPHGGGHTHSTEREAEDDCCTTPPCGRSCGSSGEAVASPFCVLHVLLGLPGGGRFRGVELLMDAALTHDMEVVGDASCRAMHADCPTLATLRTSGSDAVLRDPQRSALNVLLSAAFGDAMPMFDEMLHVPHPPPPPLVSTMSIDSPDDPRGGSSAARRISARGSVVSLAGASSTSNHSSITLPTIVCPASIGGDEQSSPNNRMPVSPGGTNTVQALLTGSGNVDAIPSLASEGSFMSTVEPERKSTASGTSREEHVHRLIRPTPWGALLGLVELGSGLESLEQLRATIAMLSPGVSGSATPAMAARSPLSPAALAGTTPPVVREDM